MAETSIESRSGGRLRLRALEAVEGLEDLIYALVALFLLVSAGALLFAAARDFIDDLSRHSIKDSVVSVLDQALLVFMIAELLHTVRITLRDRALAAEPFLIVGLIAGVRRILIVTAKNEDLVNAPHFGTAFSAFWVQMVSLIGLVLAMTIAIYIWRRAFPGDSGRG
ncbi:MAG: phosphate-starvation-inducible PsiE family protein [Candidatus Dormibacteria bacterium]